MKIISFNSYKGGACRTTTCYNELPYLVDKLGATSENPILVFDVDLDSMGLTNLFINGKYEKFTSEANYAAQDLFVNDRANGGSDINSRIQRGFRGTVKENDWFFGKAFMKVGEDLGFKNDPGCVLFCGADCDANTITKVDDDAPLGTLLRKLRFMKENAPKAIVFDCAAGIQLTTREIIKCANTFVMCMRPTLQFRLGTSDYLLDKIPKEIEKADDGSEREVILVPTAVASTDVFDQEENKEEARIGLERLKMDVRRQIRKSIIGPAGDKTEAMLHYKLNTKMVVDDDMGLPEIERFKWEECLIYKIEKPWTSAEKRLMEKYALLAQLIAKE